MRFAVGGANPGAGRHHTGWPTPGHVRLPLAPRCRREDGRFVRFAGRTASWGDSFPLRSGRTHTTDPGGGVDAPYRGRKFGMCPFSDAVRS